MEDKEVFTLSIKFKGSHLLAEVTADLPSGFEQPGASYSIKVRRQVFVIKPGSAPITTNSWELVSGTADKQLTQLIGEAIARHYKD